MGTPPLAKGSSLPFFPEIYYKAAGGICRHLNRLVGNIEELSLVEIQERTSTKGVFAKGWSFPFNVDDHIVILGIFLRNCFPLSPPVVYLLEPHEKMAIQYPHVELSGRLCLIGPQDNAYPALNDAMCRDLCDHLLEATAILLRDNFSRKNADHFVQEFLSYWANFCRLKQTPMKPRWSLLKISIKRSRVVSHLTLTGDKKAGYLLAENQEDGVAWAKNVFGPDVKVYTQPAAFLWLKEGLMPGLYPLRNKHLRALLPLADDAAAEVLLACTPTKRQKAIRKVAKGRRNDLPICFGFDTEHGPALAGLFALPPSRNQGPKTSSGYWQPGMSNLIQRQFFGLGGEILPFNITRVDGDWLGFRGGDNSASEKKQVLSESHVVLIGAGSLGSRVAEMLCAAGVGQLTILDHDDMEAGNIGRHLLGVDTIRGNKAKETSRALLRRFPHLSLNGIPLKWEEALNIPKHKEELLGADLILSTTGELQSNLFLNRFLVSYSRKRPVPDTIFAWAEAYCCAGKAVLVNSVSGCLECGIEGGRTVKSESCTFPRERLLKTLVPACGDSFMPYGALEMNPIASMTAKFSIEVILGDVESPSQRVYVAAASMISAHDGRESDWAADFLPPRHEGTFFTAPWDQDKDCHVCRS